MASLANEITILNEEMTEVAYLQGRLRVDYQIGLNVSLACSVDLGLDDPKIGECGPMRYIKVRRKGVDLWLGRMQIGGWLDDNVSAESNIFPLDAYDKAGEMGQRTLPRPEGMDFNQRSGFADDVAKEYVFYNAGPGAELDRQIGGLYVQNDTSQVPIVTHKLLGGTLLEHLQKMAIDSNFWWGFVPHVDVNGDLDGMEFRTAFPFWGPDLRKGQPGELVLSRDNHNISKLAYSFDLTQHINHVWVAGPGDDRRQFTTEVDNRVDMMARLGYDPGRREQWITSNGTTYEELQEDGRAYLALHEPREVLTAVTLPGVVGPEHLGAQLTVFDTRYGRTVEKDCVLVSMGISEGVDGVETISPKMFAL